jgi:hypothetical protein
MALKTAKTIKTHSSADTSNQQQYSKIYLAAFSEFKCDQK